MGEKENEELASETILAKQGDHTVQRKKLILKGTAINQGEKE